MIIYITTWGEQNMVISASFGSYLFDCIKKAHSAFFTDASQTESY